MKKAVLLLKRGNDSVEGAMASEISGAILFCTGDGPESVPASALGRPQVCTVLKRLHYVPVYVILSVSSETDQIYFSIHFCCICNFSIFLRC